MREIKFRGKSLFICDWHIGLFSRINEQAYIEEGVLKIRVKEDTIGQYTGLKDKNGVEIYEGDIVASCGRKYVPCVVEYNQDRCEFVMRYDGNGILHIVEEFKNSYEVIGNIYDNPELLEVEE